MRIKIQIRLQKIFCPNTIWDIEYLCHETTLDIYVLNNTGHILHLVPQFNLAKNGNFHIRWICLRKKNIFQILPEDHRRLRAIELSVPSTVATFQVKHRNSDGIVTDARVYNIDLNSGMYFI